MASSQIYKVTRPRSALDHAVGAAKRLDAAHRVRQAYRSRRGQADLWLSDAPELFRKLEGRPVRASAHRLLLWTDRVAPQRLEFLRSWFRPVAVYGDDPPEAAWLDAGELSEALSAEHRDELVLRVTVDRADDAVVLLRGYLERLVVPMGWFTRGEPAQEPDFSSPRITDCGQTLAFGDYDAAVDAILYEFDPEVRRAQKERARDLDDSFGASLRRLRLQKGLTREDFAPVGARQIRRIEAGDLEEPPADGTLEILADRLGVEPDEIATY